jgi:tetratricopeptide (TPR) repeat protein
MTHNRHIPSKPVSQLARVDIPTISYLHSLAMMGDERWEEAITALQRFMGLNDNPADRQMAYQNLGACYLALERFDEALAALDEVRRIRPDDPEAIYSRGVVCACASRFPEAIAAFELYTRNWPQLARQREVKKTLHMLHQIERGEIPPGSYLLENLQEQIFHNLEVDDFHLVESKARRMIAALPERPEGHFALGLACLEQDRYLEALEAFQAAQLRDPNFEPVLYNIGHTYLKLDQPEPAISWLERALRRDPKNVNTMHQLGVACQRLGRSAEAVGWWKRCLEIDPNYGPAQQRLYENGEGPEPVAPASPNQEKLRLMTPEVKARMRKPQIYRNGSITLTFDGRVGFVLEDADNSLNGTVHAGSPFTSAIILDEDLLDMMGLVKMLLRMIDANNTRDIAILIYYSNGKLFNYQARFQQGKKIEFDAQGQFVVTKVPRFFKLRIDSDLVTPYGNPMHGKLIYLNQHPKAAILISTLGQEQGS